MYKRSCYFDCCCFNVSDVWNCAQSSLLRRPKTSTKAAKAAIQPALYFWEKAEVVGLLPPPALYHHYYTKYIRRHRDSAKKFST